MTRVLCMQNVKKSYGNKPALKGLDFEVHEGEIFGFLGPSGAGKTTTIKLLTKQLNADSGNIFLFDHAITSLPPDTFQKIGVLTDTSGYYNRLTVQENIELFAGIHSICKEKVTALLKQVGLFDSRRKMASKLSRGMIQRLMLACSIVHKPRLLFLDEPTASLDPVTSALIHELLMELKEKGTTIFLTTHDMTEAEKLCDSVAFLNDGRIIAHGSPDELKGYYGTSRVCVKACNGKEKYGNATTAEIVNLCHWADQNNGLQSFYSKEPSLEEIFLTLTGRNLYR